MKRNIFISSVLFLSVLMTLSSCADKQEIAVNQETEFGTREEANDLLTRAVNLVKANETVAFAMITAGTGGFSQKDLYPFCTTMKGVWIAHPRDSGSDFSDAETSDGVRVAETMIKNAKVGEISEISYMLKRTGTTLYMLNGTGNSLDKEYKKTTLYTKVGKYICGSGYYEK